MNAFDLHTHLLPGVDDGPETLAESIETLRQCHDDGTRGVVMTPHMFSPFCGSGSVDAIRRVFDQTIGELRHLQTKQLEYEFLADMEFFLGAENYLSPEFLAALARREVLPLGNDSHLLLEFSQYTEFEAMLAAARKVVDAGFVPVLAHVDRYPPIARCPERLSELVSEGCVAQVNADALVESQPRSRRTAFSLLGEGLASVVASDVHGVGRRRSRLADARAALSARFSQDQADDWISTRPRALVEGG